MSTALTSTGVTYPDGTTQTNGRGTKSLLTTLTASNSSALQYTGFSSSYNNYELVISNLIPVTNGVNAQMQYYIGGGYGAAASSYYAAGFSTYGPVIQFATTYHYIGGSGTYFQLSYPGYMTNTSSKGLSGTLWFWNANSAFYKQLTGVMAGETYSAGYSERTCMGTTYVGSTAVLGGFQVYMSSGNISSGTIKVYGWN